MAKRSDTNYMDEANRLVNERKDEALEKRYPDHRGDRGMTHTPTPMGTSVNGTRIIIAFRNTKDADAAWENFDITLGFKREIYDAMLEALEFFVNLQTSPMNIEDAYPKEFAKANAAIKAARP